MRALEELIRQHRLLCSSSVLDFTCKMFEQMNHTPYIIGEHHKVICRELDEVVQGKNNRLIINIAPRYGKTLLVSQMFIAYCMALFPYSNFLHLSYSGSLTQDNSEAIKDIINSEYYQLLYDTRIRPGKDTKSKWDTIQGGGVYATSTLGQITGFGARRTDVANKDGNKFAGAIVIDDPIKPEDALSDNIRETINRRFETTIRNRVNSRDTPIIIIMQRLHEHDLCGYLDEVEPGVWKTIKLPCIYEDAQGVEKPLWPFKHSLEELHKLSEINPVVFETQYMQNPKPLEGLMYTNFRTYEVLPIEGGVRKAYIDTADTGSDFLCTVAYFETKSAMYITDVLYTDAPMETTEIQTAEVLALNRTRLVRCESNNGGRGFARNVEKNVRLLNSPPITTEMQFVTFTQSANKKVRIFTHSNEVQNLIFFPKDWEHKWPKFSSAIKSYRKMGSNAHDDAPDVLTGMAEYFRKESFGPMKAKPIRYSTERK